MMKEVGGKRIEGRRREEGKERKEKRGERGKERRGERGKDGVTMTQYRYITSKMQ